MPTQLTVKKLDGTAGSSIEGSERLFAAKINTGLIHQAVQAEMTNRRQGTQSTKTRGVVHHTTRKPFRQKGTGRARQGMTSAPHFRHGGIALGPLPRDFHHDMPKKMRRAAIAAALTSKAQDNAVMVTDAIAFAEIGTKQAAALLGKLELAGKKVLLILPQHDTVIYKSFRNIPAIQVRVAPAFSTRDVVDANAVVFVGDALSKVESLWSGAEATE